MGTRNRGRALFPLLLFPLLALLAGERAWCEESDEGDPFKFMKDGSLERGEDPDPAKVIGVLVKTKLIRVKRTNAGDVPLPSPAADKGGDSSAGFAEAILAAPSKLPPCPCNDLAKNRAPAAMPVPAIASPAPAAAPVPGGAESVNFGGPSGKPLEALSPPILSPPPAMVLPEKL